MPWLLTSGATTKSFADWGLARPIITLKSWATDTLTFRASGRLIDATPLFPIWSTLSVKEPAGICRFVGIVTKIPVAGSSKAEDQNYEVSGPWWYFENLVFQQEWMVGAAQGSGEVFGALVPTLQTTTIIGQQADGTSIDLGQLATIVLNYVLSTAAASAPPFVPFQLGTMTPDTIVPFSEVTDLTCAQILKTIFSFVPDATIEFDYTTTPPTLNVSQRGNGTPVALPVFVTGPVSGVELTPRSDLVVPAVILKYKQTNTIDGTVYSTITPDIYPVGAQDPAFRNLVADVDLQPGNESFLKQNLTTTDRPKDYDSVAATGALSTVTWNWLLGQKRAAWLKGYTIPANWPVGLFPYVQGNTTDQDVFVPSVPIDVDPSTLFVIRRVVTTLTDNFTSAADDTTDPPTPSNTLVLPSGNVTAGAGPGTAGTGENALDYLGEELINGSVTDWMTSIQSISSALVNIAVTVNYMGTDPVIAAWFGVPSIPFAFAGQAILTLNCPTLVTNGETQLYTQQSSLTPSEPIPVGLAQNIYKGRAVLHYEGTVETSEQECSAAVGMGNVLNLSGGAGAGAAWATMNAQIFEITRSLEDGKTRIRVGPPVQLDAGQLVANLRALRGRIQSYHLDQQKTGKADSNNSISGAGATAHGGAHNAPGGAGGAAGSWSGKVNDTSTGATGQVKINGDRTLASINDAKVRVNGTDNDAMPSPNLAITGNGDVYIKVYLNDDGTVNTSGGGGSGVDAFFGALPDPDTASPPTYGVKRLASIVGYTVTAGIVSFSIIDAVGPVGVTTAQVCLGSVIIT
jgi:hypothetical protein